jgi:glutamate synthase domain-containing protein 1
MNMNSDLPQSPQPAPRLAGSSFSHSFQKDISNCGMIGIIHKRGSRIGGQVVIKAIGSMRDRGNGLGGGFSAYGIYPEFRDLYAFHIMFEEASSKRGAESYLSENYTIHKSEPIPIRPLKVVSSPPLLWRYFLEVKEERMVYLFPELDERDFVMKSVMKINSEIPGAYVFSSGKDMGGFKGVGYAEDIGRFYRLEEYEGYLWTAHQRFPTNTPGWWGGAHPFCLLDWSIVHNGEISSYGINKRYLEMFGYRCNLFTDTEVIAYLFDLLSRRHRLPLSLICQSLAAPFWKTIDRMPEEERGLYEAMRTVYGSALLNGPFAILVGHHRGLIGLTDRIKLRPLVAGIQGDFVFMASEESAIREISPRLEKVWALRAGEPLMVELEAQA